MDTEFNQQASTIHIGSIIRQVLSQQRYTASWLAKQLYCDRTNIYKIFHRASIDCELLLKISEALNYNFFKYYTRQYENFIAGCSKPGNSQDDTED